MFVFFELQNNRLGDEVAHIQLAYDREGFVQEHQKCYSVRVEGGSFRSHNLTGHGKQTLYWRTYCWHGEVATRQSRQIGQRSIVFFPPCQWTLAIIKQSIIMIVSR